ncbi:MAG: transglycosylase SLT domain-containing protein [Syntrophales bacterium]
MKLFNILLIPCDTANDFHLKLKKRITLHFILEAAKLFFIVAIAAFFLLEYAAPFAQKSLRIGFPDRIKEFLSFTRSARESSVGEVLHLASMIRLITDDQLSEGKALRYAGLISQASQKFGVNPLEIIALIMAESGFKENVINKETGDYGLGQVNWGHWGKDYGYTPQQLLDPAINIFLTCHVYKFFGEDFGKYHRGSGIQCRAYLVNVKSILSTLDAFEELKKRNIS